MAKSGTSSRKTAKPTSEPRLGIFWLVNGQLLHDSVPLSESEPRGDYRDYPGSHIDKWAEWLRIGKAPAESEYDEFPRGRITHDARDKHFNLFADRNILRRKELIDAIKKEFHLPKQTSVGTDPHYKCFHCLYSNADDAQ
jgi:hypothetical protein